MIKIYTIKNLVQFTSEQIILFGLLDNLKNVAIEPYNINFKGESRYHNLIDFCKKTFSYVDNIKDCDIAVLPYKFKGPNDNNFKILNNLTKQLNKTLFIFFNDDYDKNILPPSPHIKIFRTSFNKSSKLSNEFALPAFSPDYFNNNFISNPSLNIGYCGHLLSGREKYLQSLDASNLKTNFILRKGFWAPGINKVIAKKEYIQNIDNNLFTFCYRGGGNFSYRLYDVLMMGRIPILITTDSVFPHEDKYNINDIGIVIAEKDIINMKSKPLIDRIKEYYNKNKPNLLNIQKQNRTIWEKYLSTTGFLKTLSLNILPYE